MAERIRNMVALASALIRGKQKASEAANFRSFIVESRLTGRKLRDVDGVMNRKTGPVNDLSAIYKETFIWRMKAKMRS